MTNFANITDAEYAVFHRIAIGQDWGHRRGIVLGLMVRGFVEPYGRGRWRVTAEKRDEWRAWMRSYTTRRVSA
jgi:hypothetical protein